MRATAVAAAICLVGLGSGSGGQAEAATVPGLPGVVSSVPVHRSFLQPGALFTYRKSTARPVARRPFRVVSDRMVFGATSKPAMSQAAADAAAQRSVGDSSLTAKCKSPDPHDGCVNGRFVIHDAVTRKSRTLLVTVPTVVDDHGVVTKPNYLIVSEYPTILGRSLLVSMQAGYPCSEHPNEDAACTYPTQYSWASLYDWPTGALRHTWTFTKTYEGNCVFTGDEGGGILAENSAVLTVVHHLHNNECVGATSAIGLSTDTRIYRLDRNPDLFTVINRVIGDQNGVSAYYRPQGRVVMLDDQSNSGPDRLILLKAGVLPPQSARLFGAGPTGWTQYSKTKRTWAHHFHVSQSLTHWHLTIRRSNGALLVSERGTAMTGTFTPTWNGRFRNKATGTLVRAGRYVWRVTGTTPDGGVLIGRLGGSVTGHLTVR